MSILPNIIYYRLWLDVSSPWLRINVILFMFVETEDVDYCCLHIDECINRHMLYRVYGVKIYGCWRVNDGDKNLRSLGRAG